VYSGSETLAIGKSIGAQGDHRCDVRGAADRELAGEEGDGVVFFIFCGD
jgi:hypothetical protein